MDGLTPSTWFPVVTLLAGVALKGLFDWLGDSRKDAIEQRVRVEKRRELLLMQRLETQRKLLPDLQEALSELMRSVGLINLSDIEHYRSTGNWGKGKLADELSEKSRAAFRSVTLYKVRVHDDELREAISDLSSTCSLVTLATSEARSREILDEASFKYDYVNDLIGRTLRSLDSSENAIFECS